MNREPYKEAIVLGVQVAAIIAHPPYSGTPSQNVRLELHSTSGVDDGAFYPAESFSINGLQQMKDLRDLIDRGITFASAKLEPVKPLEVDKEAFLKS